MEFIWIVNKEMRITLRIAKKLFRNIYYNCGIKYLYIYIISINYIIYYIIFEDFFN